MELVNDNFNDCTEDMSDVSIFDFYKDTNIFITGGSGFVGKVLIEKLLRTFCDVKSICILLRPKKGLSVEKRVEEYRNGPIFKNIRERHPQLLDKLKGISGDISSPNLGLEGKQMSAIKEINIVFHIAATVRFNEPLKEAIFTNVLGTQNVLIACKEMKNLKSFIHVSTAFAVVDKEIVEEIVYKPKYDTQLMLKCLDIIPNDMLEEFTRNILEKHPNTYTYTKAMAEYIVNEYSTIIPSAIVRPSIISAAWKEPYPGWVDSLNGATGILLMGGKGLLRSMLGEKDYTANLIPVDIVTDTLITVPWHMNHQSYSGTSKVYNCTNQTHPITWKELLHLTLKYSTVYPTKYVTLYPNLTYTTSKLIFTIYSLIYSIMPAAFMDIYSFIRRKRTGMLKLSLKFHHLVVSLSFFTQNEFYFGSNNMKHLIGTLKEQKLTDVFNIDINHKDFNWDAYIREFFLGIRKYILKDEITSMPEAKSKLQRLYWIQTLLILVFCMFFGIFLLHLLWNIFL